ncbi:MAG TPA: 50S ribosomal protein L4 [Candidatus Saccharimonadales bacterium]|nr:50S ribosomal protein L4 [Candidatus Saccharimonadales bacterium]
MKIDVLDTKGKVLEQINLDKKVFEAKVNSDLVAQYVRVFQSNQRQGTVKTKTRGDVSGGGKKPWKQKGTGRARVGSSRNPLWVHGGASHGPQPKDWTLRMPKKMKRAALFSVLTSKLATNQIKILDKIESKLPKTKELGELLSNLKLQGRTLIILGDKNDNIRKSAENLNKVATTLVSTLNPYEILLAKNIIFEKDAVHKLEKKYSK